MTPVTDHFPPKWSVVLHARGDAPAAVAWERYADLSCWPLWSPQVQRVDAGADRLEAGITGTVRAGLLPRPTLPVRFTVDAVDHAAMTWAWTVRLPVGRLRLEHGVTARTSGSATWLRLHGPLPAVLAYAPLARVALGRLVAG